MSFTINKVIVAEASGICSTEFHVMRIIDENEIIPEYLVAIMRSSLILAQTKHMMTGNTHPRISNDDVQAKTKEIFEKELISQSGEN